MNKYNRKNYKDVIFPIILIVITVISMFLYGKFSADYVKDKTYSSLNDLSGEQTSNVISNIDSQYTTLETFVTNVSERSEYNIEEITNEMNLIVRVSNFKYLAISTKDGMMYTNDGRIIDCSKKDYFKESISGNRSIAKLQDDRFAGNEDLFVLSVPVMKNKTVTGVLIGIYSNADFSKVLNRNAFAGKSSVMIINSDGDILFRNASDNISTQSNIFEFINNNTLVGKYNSEKIKNSFKNGVATTAQYKFKGETRYVVYQPLGLNDWFIAYGVSGEVVESDVKKNSSLGFILGLTVMLCALMFILYLLFLQKRMNELHYEQILMYSTDELTGFFNKRGFEIRAGTILSKTKHKYFIITFDINNFESYNSLYGSVKGDELLSQIGDTIRKTLRHHEIAARFYADEFACLVYGESFDEIKDRIVQSKVAFDEISIVRTILVSYGIYEINDKTLTVNQMVDCSKTAKKHVKGSYDNNVGIYDDEMHKKQLDNIRISGNAEKAIETKKFYARYQPKYDVKSRKAISAEALARWDFEDGEIYPDKFIDLFEKNGFVVRLDYYMLETVCKKLREFIDDGITPIPVAVNFSQKHLYETDFAEKIIKIIDNYKIDSSLIEIEFTETTIACNISVIIPIMKQLKKAGLTVTMDDFGSGYSSLNLLKNIPVDKVKLDKEFLNMNENSEKGKCIIKNLINLADELDLKTVAEGVETKEQFKFLEQCNCSTIQGYYFSKPLDEEKFTELVIELSQKDKDKGKD